MRWTDRKRGTFDLWSYIDLPFDDAPKVLQETGAFIFAKPQTLGLPQSRLYCSLKFSVSIRELAQDKKAGGPEMNRLVSGTVGFLNGLIAISLVIGGAVIGTAFTHAAVGFVVGGIIGLIVAAIICGFLALVIEIRSELVRIREALERSNPRPG